MHLFLKIDFRISVVLGLLLSIQPLVKVAAQNLSLEQEIPLLSSSFRKPEIFQKASQLSFNIVQVRNLTDQDVRIKPIFILPDGWALFSSFSGDTLIPAHDSVSLSLRYRISSTASSDSAHKVYFRAYSMTNVQLTESYFKVYPEAYHDWDVTVQGDRAFFYPGSDAAELVLSLTNKGNTKETISLNMEPDNKLGMDGGGEWKLGKEFTLDPFTDTTIKLNVTYRPEEEKVFDISKLNITAVGTDKIVKRVVMIEKYDDTYAPLFIDRSLPHQTEVGARTFTGNKKFLPFIKARGFSTFKNKSTLVYNFNYYSITENEDFISNSYYNVLYQWQTLKVGLGAFSSQYGRNLYTRNGIMVSNVVRLTPSFSMEAYISQSILTPKTSAAVGYAFEIKKIKYNGSIAYDRDADRKANTSSLIFQTGSIPIFSKNHHLNVSFYGYNEYHYPKNDYTLTGIAYDLNYYGRIGQSFTIQLTNNYGSPNVPGPQMGLLSFVLNATYAIENQKRYFSTRYAYGSRDYYTYNFDGGKLPGIELNDQYVNLLFHSNTLPNHNWEAGPSIEFYHSLRPSTKTEGVYSDYRAQKFRFEYKSVIAKNLTINLKAGISDIRYREVDEIFERRYDFHVLGGYSMVGGYGIAFSYDYGPMVNTGLYQYAGDVLNHSISFGPNMMTSYFHGRIYFNLFTNFLYRFDLQHASININPKIEAFLHRDWYLVMSGTYHYVNQKYPDYTAKSSYAYLEVSIKKRWGKSDFNKWEKDTRRLKIILFKDENSNGIKDYGELGVPFVKTRLRLTNSASSNVSTQFPVDIILLSNDEGVVTFNRLPVGFYDLIIYPLSDVREYFYVDRGAEKLELTKTSVYYIPFQKASKLTGSVDVKRSQFSKEGDEKLDLKNIRITAYNNKGNSYSSFTLEDGTFTIFLPGDNEYFVRMPNVFGDNFKILNNDIAIFISDTTQQKVEFRIVESTRQIAFKKAQPAQPDTVKEEALKIKVLHGKLYENPALDTVDVNAPPQFNIQFAPPNEQILEQGRYYVVTGDATDRAEALKLHRILDENGVNAYLGLDKNSGKYYVFTNHYTSEESAKKEHDRLKKAGLKGARVIKYQ